MKSGLSLGSFLLVTVVFANSYSAAQDSNGTAVSTTAAARFLQQASWGPTPAAIIELQKIGFEEWLNQQFDMSPSPLADAPAGTKNLAPLQQQFFANAVNGRDQLRQRVAFALSEIWVVSGLKVRLPEAMAPYLRTLAADAFANYRDLMRDLTLSPAMGHYLDMVNNDKPNPQAGKSADENYARELMQLFTLGEVILNPDGSPRLGSDGRTIPAYSEQTVQSLARALTGWTYPPVPGTASKIHNPAYWEGPMVSFDSNHDRSPKTLLYGFTLPAAQTAMEDLQGALDNIFNHPNVGPFISRQLIQHLVTSNPTPAYVERIAGVFANNGSGTRGDLKSVVRAILLDPEARAGDAPFAFANGRHPRQPVAFIADIFRTAGKAVGKTILPDPEVARPSDGADRVADFGHLKEPVVFVTGLLRALGAAVDDTNTLGGNVAQMGQNVYYAPSVFNYFAPGYRIPGTDLPAPEFQIFSTSTAIIRTNFVNALIFGHVGQGTQLDLAPFQAMAPQDLIETLDVLLTSGHITPEARQSIVTAVNAAETGQLKTRTALYLIATSAFYQVAY